LTVNIGLPITNFELAYVIVGSNFGLACVIAAGSINGFLAFVALDDIFFCCGCFPIVAFVILGTIEEGRVWSGAGCGVLQVQSGDFHDCAWIGDFRGCSSIGDGRGSYRIGDGHGSSRIGDGDGSVSGNIEVGAVLSLLAVVDAEAATADGSASIEVHLH
jgi:hypothetical protein